MFFLTENDQVWHFASGELSIDLGQQSNVAVKNTHPSKSELERFDCGQLTDSAAIWIERHLEHCPRCCKFLAGIDRQDRFVSRIQEAIHRTEELDIGFSPVQVQKMTQVEADPTKLEVTKKVISTEDANENDDVLTHQSLGQFTLLKRIGRGGFGVVWLAYDTRLQRQVALKLPHQGTLENQLASNLFFREARAIACLQHPNIVQVFEAGTIDQWCYLATEYCPGRDLSHWLQTHSQELGYTEIATIIRQLAYAVDHAHQRGVLHRDLKPSNVLLHPIGEAQHGGEPVQFGFVPKVSDFGLAKLTLGDPHETASQVLMGTASYMAPEQSDGSRRADRAADIYSLGAIFYELLTGQPPFDGSTQLETLYRVKHDSVVSPSRKRPSVPRDLEAICLCCLQFKPGDRYSSAAALAEDLRCWLEGEPIHARKATHLERFTRWCRRKPWIAVASSLLVTLVVVLIIFSAVIWDDRNKMAQALVDLQIAEGEAKAAELNARRQLFDKLCAEVRECSNSSEPGSRLEGFEKSAQAVALAQHLGVSAHELVELRNHAIACIASTVDLQEDCRWTMFPHGNTGNGLAFDPEFERFAVWTRDMDLSVRRLRNNQELARIEVVRVADAPTIRRKDWRTFLRFSPNGRFLASCGVTGEMNCTVWDLENDGKAVIETPALGTWDSDRMDFSHDNRLFVCATQEGMIRVFDMESGQLQSSTHVDHPIRSLRFHPSECRLAYTSQHKAIGFDLESMQISWQVDFEDQEVYEIQWHPDGRHVAVTQDNDVAYCLESELVHRFEGHDGSVVMVAFHPDGQFMSTTSWDGTSRIWNVETRQALLRLNGEYACGFSRDGNWLGFGQSGADLGRWRFVASTAVREINGEKPAQALAFARKGSVLLSGDAQGIKYWDTSNMEWIGEEACDSIDSLQISNDQKTLIMGGANGVVSRTIGSDANQPDQLLLGSFHSLVSDSYDSECWVSTTPDGGRILVTGHDRNGLKIVDVKTNQTRQLRERGIWRHAISPCGRWAVTSSWNQFECLLWDLREDLIVRRFQARNGIPVFSPDGQWLVVGRSTAYLIVETKGWSEHAVMALNNDNGERLSIFDETSSLMAAVVSRDQIALMETEQWNELARLQLPSAGYIESLAINGPGDKLACGTRDGRIVIWNLSDIRNKLAAIHLDWEASPLPDASPTFSTTGISFVTTDQAFNAR